MKSHSFEPRKTKFMISPAEKFSHPENKSMNIFINETISSFPVQNVTMYSIVGDRSFKEKLIQRKKDEQKQSNQKSVDQTDLSTSFRQQTFCKYASQIQNGMLTHKLSKDKQIDINRDSKIFTQFKFHKKRDQKIEKYLNRTVYKNKSIPNREMNFNSISQFYAHPNPEKDELINDNVPEYWKNSLRDNQKRLKRHLKGNTYKQTIAEEMLQTLRGRTLLEKSIPKIREEYIQGKCSRKCPKLKRKGFSLKGVSPSHFSKTEKIQDKGFRTLQSHNSSIFNSDFEEVHKCEYDSKNRWRVSEFSTCTKFM